MTEEKLESGFCDTCRFFVKSVTSRALENKGKCRRYPSVQEISMAEMNWCGDWETGKQRVPRASSKNPDGIIEEPKKDVTKTAATKGIQVKR